ncbi:MAG: hypothetical protein KKA65_00120 [Nanoarchaeota archaeon]|nr:hypothetical protein [Nanoarchaeota archaeon]MBU4352123.1 hypothetical protein [Nanoarchaeota archaeon]MBU4455891.1 hypothetical protein [Nanoarchaeota archaeon]MCG2720228.1 hypothetical protein [Nanoarchaeota archaeon]
MDNLEKDIVEYFKKIGAVQGMDELSSTIIGILYSAVKEITMEDIVRKTGYSLASISNKIKFLSDIGLITKKTKPGNKKIYLYMEKDFMKMIHSGLLIIEKKLDITKKEIPLILEKHKKTKDKRLKSLELMQKNMKIVSGMLKDFVKRLEGE